MIKLNNAQQIAEMIERSENETWLMEKEIKPLQLECFRLLEFVRSGAKKQRVSHSSLLTLCY